jgi:transposase-like protein
MATKKESPGSEARPASAESGDARAERGRFSVKRKTAAVLRLLRGEDLDKLSRELGVTAATLSAWREDFLASGSANLKSRHPNPQDEEVLRLKAMIGDLTMSNEVLREGQRIMNLPLAQRRLKR